MERSSRFSQGRLWLSQIPDASWSEKEPVEGEKRTPVMGMAITSPEPIPTPAAKKSPRTRFRIAKEFPPIPDGTVLYGKGRPELKQMDDGELMYVIVRSTAWRDVVAPVCEELDRTRPTHGPKPLYTSEELEYVLLYQLLCGLRCYREARDRLAGDRGAVVRAALGFNRPRSLRGRRVVSLTSGVPSEPTISRHLNHFDPELRCATYRRLFERLVREHFEFFPEFREDARVLGMDGTHILTHFTAPVYREQTKDENRQESGGKHKTLDELCEIDRSRVVNETEKITCRDGGYLPYDKTMGKAGGHGFNLVATVTANGLPLEFAVVPINASEKRVGEAILRERFAHNVLPRLDRTRLHILTADGGFTSPTLRNLLRSFGILENIQMVSHGKEERTRLRAEVERGRAIPIEGYPNWHANGLREISCACGSGLVSSRVGVSRRGCAFARLEGRCTTCGSITITSGQWRLAQNPKQFRLAHPGDPVKNRDWTFGNPLTYDSPVAAALGKARFGQNEGFHGALERRFRLIKGKRWYRSRVEAETDTAVIFCVMHALAMEQRRRAAAQSVEKAA
jgi:hypothetical protein